MELSREQYTQLVGPVNAFLAERISDLSVAVDNLTTNGYAPEGWDDRFDYSGPGLVVSDRKARGYVEVAVLLEQVREDLRLKVSRALDIDLEPHIDPIVRGLCGLTFVATPRRY